MQTATPVMSTIDLSNCEREPIHIPGAIQPHGILLALDGTDLRIVQLSENTNTMLGIDSRELLGRSVEEIVGSDNFEILRDAAARGSIEDVNPLTMVIATAGGRMSVDVVLHRSSGEILLECEPVDPALPVTFHGFYRDVRSSIVRFDSARTVIDLCDVAVDEVARITGFDRVMAYRFGEDWHGEVIAERRAYEMEPFLGLHYPASDIPRQARDLFSHNWLRYIADVNYRPAVIFPSKSSVTGEPVDLSRAVLRSASPIHIEYLKNMGVGASMTISLIKNGELWGLIACHHRSPKIVPYSLRMACEVIARTMSLHLGSKEENEAIERRITLKSVEVVLLEALSKDPDIARTLAEAEPALLALVGAKGAAIAYGDECTLVGRTPPRAGVAKIIAWLQATGSDEMFASDSLPSVEPAFAELAATACGIIALPISRVGGNYIVWFRPEAVVAVNWGGDPSKPLGMAQDGRPLTPRTSFDLWRQIVHLHARPWQRAELDAARAFRHAVGSIIVERAEELERLNRELTRSNVELNAFAHIASHDLKEPLRGIHNYASYLIEDYGTVVDAAGREKLETLVRLSQQMNALIESLLQLSHAGQVDLVGVSTALPELIGEVVDIYLPLLEQRHGSVTIVTPLPRVVADRVALREVFNNLFSNAIKYCEGPPHIEIGEDLRQQPPRANERGSFSNSRQFVTLFVRDNGIGIRERHLNLIFQLFKRLHAADAFGGGTGAGLAIARRIVERHAGQMWVASTLGAGSTFFFTLPRGT